MRVLLVDDQPGSRKRLGAMLVAPSIEKIEATDIDSVLAWTRDIDLAIVRATFDEDAGAPEGGVTLQKLRKLLDAFDAPFVVLTPMTSGGLSVVRLSQAHYLFTFGAPLDVPRLERTVDALVASFRRATGRIADESLDLLLTNVVKDSESGVLTVNRGMETRRVVVDRGKIIFVAVEKTGDNEDLFEGHDCGDEPSSRAAWDAVLELYLWPEGEWTWFGARIATDTPCALPILLAPLRAEGKRRQGEWLHLREDMPPDEAKLKLRKEVFPPGFPAGDRDRMLVDRINAGSTVGEIRAAWGRQDFAICRRLVDLLRLGLIERIDVQRPRRTMEAMALAPYRSVRLLRSVDELFRMKLSAQEGFLVSRLSKGELLVEDVLSMCPVPWEDVLVALGALVEKGFVGVRDLRGEARA